MKLYIEYNMPITFTKHSLFLHHPQAIVNEIMPVLVIIKRSGGVGVRWTRNWEQFENKHFTTAWNPLVEQIWNQWTKLNLILKSTVLWIENCCGVVGITVEYFLINPHLGLDVQSAVRVEGMFC